MPSPHYAPAPKSVVTAESCKMFNKPYLVYDADVITWSRSLIISSICYMYVFNSAMHRIYKVQFECLDMVYMYRVAQKK